MEGAMRLALLTIIIVAALGVTRADARTDFYCFATPVGERCACEGDDSCRALHNSDSCVSDPQCDNRELGILICSCKAISTSQRDR
jgi:hypothetical protein